MILQASIPRVAPNGILAALVLEVDTIPKPHGLGSGNRHYNYEQNSDNLGQYFVLFGLIQSFVQALSRICSMAIHNIGVVQHPHCIYGRNKWNTGLAELLGA